VCERQCPAFPTPPLRNLNIGCEFLPRHCPLLPDATPHCFLIPLLALSQSLGACLSTPLSLSLDLWIPPPWALSCPRGSKLSALFCPTLFCPFPLCLLLSAKKKLPKFNRNKSCRAYHDHNQPAQLFYPPRTLASGHSSFQKPADVSCPSAPLRSQNLSLSCNNKRS
jgi:hypothetical protein